MYQRVPFYRSCWNGNFRYKYLENHTVYFVENYMIVKLKYCIIIFYTFYFLKMINYHFNSENFTFKLVVKLLSALSVNTVLAYRYFWLSNISKINMEFLNPLYRKTLIPSNTHYVAYLLRTLE